jgi:hypothetical protein
MSREQVIAAVKAAMQLRRKRPADRGLTRDEQRMISRATSGRPAERD